MKYLSFNINDYVWVMLTPEGKKIYQHQFDKYPPEIGLIPSPLHVEKDGWIKFNFWELMEIFGSHIYFGCNVPFVDNIILFDIAHLNSLDRK